MRYSLFFTRASEICHLFGYLNRLELRWVSSDIRVLHLNSNTLDILRTCHPIWTSVILPPKMLQKKVSDWKTGLAKHPKSFSRTRVKRFFFWAIFVFSGIWKQLSGTNGKMVKLLMENPTFKCLESEDGMVHWTKARSSCKFWGGFWMVLLQKLLPVNSRARP